MFYSVIRPALFALDPERAHRLTLRALRASPAFAPRSTGADPIECLGLTFPNRVGLAAGFDKNAVAVDALGHLGFGFLEVGTVTPRAQPGQTPPRLFRFPAAGALLNRLGFPNEGADAAAARLRGRRFRGVVGVNIGKNADTPLERATDDYVSAFRSVQTVADYVAVNVSSPNTAALRDLQSRARLEPLLTALLEERAQARRDAARPLPLLVKISPDMDAAALLEVADTVRVLGVDGVIATNTTLNRALLPDAREAGSGGISGRPLRELALQTVRSLRSILGPSTPIIGVGGVDSPEAALAMRAAGADLVQLYTGLVYRGPGLVMRCVRALTAGS